MVKSQLAKSTFREIRSSLGRFLAILAIIGLGVGFFAGLKVAREAMVATVDGYLTDNAFYDYRLLSTMGFDQEGLDYISAQEGVAGAEGGLSFDVLYYLESGEELSAGYGGEGYREEEYRGERYQGYRGEDTAAQGVVKTYSLPGQLNTVKLLSGRMPADDHECVADANRFGEEDLGSVLVLSEENDGETLEHFSRREYTIVGLVQSPLYLQYERGNTSLGTGRLDGFVYLPPEGYAEDYFTEIYVRFDGEFGLYSDEYETFIDGVGEAWEDYGEQAAYLRFQSILADAEEELSDAREELEDARKELDEKRAEGEAELADAQESLADAEEKLTEGQQALEDAGQELSDAEKTLQEKERELADAKITLAEKEQEFSDGERELQEGIDSWNESSSELDAAESRLRAAAEEAEAGRQQIAPLKAELTRQQALLDQLDDSITQLQAALEQFQSVPEEMLTPELLVQKDQMESQLAQLLATQASGHRELSAGWAQIHAAEAELGSAEAQIRAGLAEVEAGNRQLASAWMEIQDSRQELEKGRLALEDAREEIAEGERAIADAKADLQDAEETLAEKEAELADAWAEYEDGEQEYLDAQAEFDQKIADAEAELADAEAELADAEAELADLEAPDTYLLGRDTNVGYVCFENDSTIVEGIANIFPVFFILVAVLVCITTMNRMVEEQRTQIGVLKAIGYSGGAVMSKYIIYSGLASVVGCVAGFFLGTWAFPNVVWAAYGIMYRAEDLVYVLDWKLGLFCLAVALVCSVGATWLSCRVELSQVAAQLMRPKAPKAGKRVFLERIPLIWNHLSFLRKVSLRNIFRYKKRLFMMILGISGCTALLVTGFGIKDSIADIGARQFGEIQIFDLAVALKDPVDDDTCKALDALEPWGLSDYLCIMEKNMDLVTDGGVKSIYLIAGEPGRMPGFWNLHTTAGEAISYPGAGEGVISNKLAEEYNISPGDVITLRDDEMRELTLTVTGIQKNYIYNYVHISETTWEDQMGESPERRTVYVNVLSDGAKLDEHGMAAKLMELDNVSNVTVNLDTMERLGNMMASLNIIVVAVIISAAGLAFIVLYNLTNINITERIREIATIKVLGFYKKETESYVFRENLILSVLGMALGLVLGRWLHAFVMNEIRVDMISFEVYVKPVSYLYSGILTIGFAWSVSKAMGGKLENISMTESLKSVD